VPASTGWSYPLQLPTPGRGNRCHDPCFWASQRAAGRRAERHQAYEAHARRAWIDGIEAIYGRDAGAVPACASLRDRVTVVEGRVALTASYTQPRFRASGKRPRVTCITQRR
jgi:esterase/lipase superfamily enzyme